jgi:uncharacterized membrane protein HdeD (DUF308 family)
LTRAFPIGPAFPLDRTASLTAAAFFWKFWRQTRDVLFVAFSAAFLVEGINRISVLFLERPDEGNPATYIVRFLAFLLIVVAIVNKNRRK